jgi:TPR repeat protein
MMKRVEANDPVALSEMGLKLYLEGDFDSTFEYLKKAAELGDIEAHYI